MADFLQTLLTALTLGCLYALIALGYTMVFGVLKLINFAHSDVVALGAWTSVAVSTMLLPILGIDLSLAPWYAAPIVLVLTMALCGAVGFAIERLAYKPIRKSPRLNALITAIGVSLLLQNVGQLQFNLLDNKTVIAQGDTKPREAGKPGNVMPLPIALTLDGQYDYFIKIKPRTDTAPTTSPTDELADDRATIRKITGPPGAIAADSYVQLDGNVGNALLRSGYFSIVQVNHRPPIKLPFGAKPASIPEGLLPRDSGQTVGLDRKDIYEQKAVEWRPIINGQASNAVLVQFNLFSDRTTTDGRTIRIYKPVKITTIDLTIIVTAIGLLIGLQWLVFHTRVGTAMRAVSFNMDTAALMGIPVDRIVSITFVTGTVLAAAAGFLYALRIQPVLQTADNAWVLLGLKAFVAAVVGGIGNIRGATIGGLLIAFIEQFSAYFCSQWLHWDRGSALTDVYVFALLILVLLVKPAGLFGSAVREKV